MSDAKMKPDYEAIGNLVKSWVLDDDRLKIPNPADPDGKNFKWTRPESTTGLTLDKARDKIAELREQFRRAETNFVIPDDVTEVKVVQSSRTRLVLKLPAKETIEAFEELMKDPNQVYPTPDFYMYAVSTSPTTEEDKLRLDAQRIGDYTISNCAA